ncbi:MAG: NHL repeat-containing protein [Bacillota bacterium]
MNPKLRWALISGMIIWVLAVIFVLVYGSLNKNILEETPPAVARENGEPYFLEEIGIKTNVPLAVAVSDDRVYVTNSGQSRVHMYDKQTSRLVKQLGEYGEKDGQFVYPNALAVTDREELLVGEFRTGRIQVFNKKGEFLRVINSRVVGRPLSPLALAVNEQGTIFVANRTGEVLVLDAKGKLVTYFGKPGQAEGQLSYPNGIAVDSEGKIFVSDSGNDRIQVFGPKGELIKVLTGPLLGISMPRGIAVDKGGRIFVTDVFAHRIAVFNFEGKYLFDFGGRGQQEGQLNFPNGLAIDRLGKIYVTDRENNRVNVYGYR